MEKALFMCQHGRPGPILLDIPIDIQKIDINPEELLGFQSNAVLSNYYLDYINKQIDRYIEDLYQAERPVFMIGGGIRIADAVDEYRELAKRLKMPSFPTWNATDIVTSDFEYYGGRIGTYGGAGRNLGIQNTDLLMAIGSRIPGRVTGGNVKSFARGAKKYVVDVDEALLQKHLQQLPFEETICCDAKIFIKRFLEKIDSLNKPLPDYSKWTDKVMEWNIKYDPVLPEYFKEQEYVHPYVFMSILSEKMDKNGIHVGDHGGTTVVKHHAFKTKYGQLNLSSNGNAPMGFSFAAAMGAWFADPSRQLVCTIGDGGYNLNIQELQTYVNYNIKLKVFVINNHIYGITKAFQKTNYQGRAEACGPKGYNPPDFVKVAEAYGIKAIRINKNSEIPEKIEEALNFDGPVICDVNCHEHHTYQPRIFGWETPIEDMYPYLPRDEFRANMYIDPIGDWENPPMPDVIDGME